MDRKIIVNIIFVLFINISLAIVIFSIYSNIFPQKYVSIIFEEKQPRFYSESRNIFSYYERLLIKEKRLEQVDQIIQEIEYEREKNLFFIDLYNINSTNFDEIISDFQNHKELKFLKSITEKKNGSTVVSIIALPLKEFDLNFIKTDEILESLRNYYFVEFYNLIKNFCINKNDCFKLTNYLNDNYSKLEFYKIKMSESNISSGKYKKFFYYYILISSIIISLIYIILLIYKKFKYR